MFTQSRTVTTARATISAADAIESSRTSPEWTTVMALILPLLAGAALIGS